MLIQKGDVMIFTLISGLEVLGRVKEVKEDRYEIENAMGIQSQQQVDENGMPVGVRIGLGVLSAFAQNNSQIGAMDATLHFSIIMSPQQVPEELIEQYSRLTGTIVPAHSSAIKMP